MKQSEIQERIDDVPRPPDYVARSGVTTIVAIAGVAALSGWSTAWFPAMIAGIANGAYSESPMGGMTRGGRLSLVAVCFIALMVAGSVAWVGGRLSVALFIGLTALAAYMVGVAASRHRRCERVGAYAVATLSLAAVTSAILSGSSPLLIWVMLSMVAVPVVVRGSSAVRSICICIVVWIVGSVARGPESDMDFGSVPPLALAVTCALSALVARLLGRIRRRWPHPTPLEECLARSFAFNPLTTSGIAACAAFLMFVQSSAHEFAYRVLGIAVVGDLQTDGIIEGAPSLLSFLAVSASCVLLARTARHSVIAVGVFGALNIALGIWHLVRGDGGHDAYELFLVDSGINCWIFLCSASIVVLRPPLRQPRISRALLILFASGLGGLLPVLLFWEDVAVQTPMPDDLHRNAVVGLVVVIPVVLSVSPEAGLVAIRRCVILLSSLIVSWWISGDVVVVGVSCLVAVAAAQFADAIGSVSRLLSSFCVVPATHPSRRDF